LFKISYSRLDATSFLYESHLFNVCTSYIVKVMQKNNAEVGLFEALFKGAHGTNTKLMTVTFY
jgi:hypothetical protein